MVLLPHWGAMMRPKLSRRKCQCCKELYVADYRNGHHQLYCAKPSCRQASKRASQRRWLSKKANRDYFRGPYNTERVQRWRKAHPGYWKKKSTSPEQPQAAVSQLLAKRSHLVTQRQKLRTLQDVCLSDHPVIIGLLSMFTGSTLQEDIASTARRVEARGRDILGLSAPGQSPTLYGCQTTNSARAPAQGAGGFQLGRPSAGESKFH